MYVQDLYISRFFRNFAVPFPSEGEYWYHAPLFGDQGEHFDFSSVRVLMSKIVAAMKLFELRKCRSCGRLNLCPKTRTISKSVQRYYFFVK